MAQRQNTELKTLLQKQKQNQTVYRLKIKEATQIRISLSDQFDALQQTYDKKIKTLEQKLQSFKNQNDSLLRQNTIFKSQIQTYQIRLLQKQKIIAALLTQGKDILLIGSSQKSKSDKTNSLKSNEQENKKFKKALQNSITQQQQIIPERSFNKIINQKVQAPVLLEKQEQIVESNPIKVMPKNRPLPQRKIKQTKQMPIQQNKQERQIVPPTKQTALPQRSKKDSAQIESKSIPPPPKQKKKKNTKRNLYVLQQQQQVSSSYLQQFSNYNQQLAQKTTNQNGQIQTSINYLQNQINNNQFHSQNLQENQEQSYPQYHEQYKQQNNIEGNYNYGSSNDFFNSLAKQEEDNQLQIQVSSIDHTDRDNSLISNEHHYFAAETVQKQEKPVKMTKKKGRRDQIKVVDPSIFE